MDGRLRKATKREFMCQIYNLTFEWSSGKNLR